MKYALIALSILLCPISTSAQKHSIYADIGLPVGFSVTYNYNLTKHFTTGIGIQGCKLYHPNNGYYQVEKNTKKFTPAVYADLRLTAWARKTNRFIVFLDIGMDMYKQDKMYHRYNNTVFNVPHNNGMYTGLGLGYFRKMTKRDGGLYLSLKMAANWFTVREYNLVSEDRDRTLWAANGSPVLSIGFKF